MLYVFDGQLCAELDCNDDAMDLQSQVNLDLSAGQEVLIVVDAFDSDEGGNYLLNITAN